jgi:hypothetical protein
MDIIITVFVIGAMIVLCYFTSGISNMAGTIFERKSNVGERSAAKGGKQ